ncbi:MAG: mandelate racemase/muconate lactonizing enzyme family protein [SAR202 cluster bacterium]|nr:mandelate racemase/muconate lactonizing enzyme family protein [SAR202 cluster bacterium]
MKICGFETRIVAIPRERGPLSDGPGQAASTFVVLRMQTDEGIEGIGYAGFTAQIMKESLKAAVDALAQEAIGDDPMKVEAINAKLLALGGSGAPVDMVRRAVAAIDVALWDIRGKAMGQPLYKVLGGYKDRIPTYYSGTLWRPHKLEDIGPAAKKHVAEGFRAIKLRLGGEPSADRDIERVRVLREAVGPNVDIMIDVNQGWTVNQAVSIGRRLEELGVYWLEDPVPHHDLAGQARVADSLDVPVVSGEYHYGIAPFRYLLEQRSLRVVMIDLLRVGGISPYMKVAHLAEAFNMPVVSHLAPEILCHAMAAIPNAITTEWMPWSLPLFKDVPRVENGEIVLPQKPGLGLEFDEETLARYRVTA